MKWSVIDVASRYEISDIGQVRRNNKIIKPFFADGYLKVDLWHNGVSKKYSIHRLVCFAYIGPPPSFKHEVAHWNGDKTDNRVENLRWATRSENSLDKVRHGKGLRGEVHPNARITQAQAMQIKKDLAFNGPRFVALEHNINIGIVQSIKSGRTWAWL